MVDGETKVRPGGTRPSRIGPGGHIGLGLVAGLFIAGLVVPMAVGRNTVEQVIGAGPGSVAAGRDTPAEQSGAAVVDPSGSEMPTRTVGAGGDVAGGPASGPGPTATEELTASDVGVTAESVRVGVLILGCGALSDLCSQGGVDPDAQRKAWQAVVDAQNRVGGIGGRQVVPVFASFNALDTSLDSMRGACVSMGEDQDVFAVVAWNFWGDPVLCFTQRYGIPFVYANGGSDDLFAASGGLLFSATPGQTRSVRNQIWLLHELGHLKGKTIGVLGLTGTGDEGAADAAVAALGELGYPVAHQSRITSDPSQRPAQTAVEVQAMKRARVDALVATHFDAQWTDEAERQQWRPQYMVSDMAGHSVDSEARTVYDMRQFEGMLAVSATTSGDQAAGVDPSAADRSCAETSGHGRIARVGTGSAAWGVIAAICNVFTIFSDGLAAAGANPTRASFAAATAGLRQLDLAGFPDGTGFPPGRTDVGSMVRVLRWAQRCTCYSPVSDYVAARH